MNKPITAVNARAFMDSLSTAGRLSEPKPQTGASTPRTCVVDRWDGKRFVSVDLVWDGAQYVEVR